MLNKDEIMSRIVEDRLSKRKRQAFVGERYYEVQHDILAHRIFFFNKDGKLVEDTLKTNTRISHGFFRELVDQEVQYLLSGGLKITHKDPQMNDQLKKYFGEDFVAELSEMLTSTVKHGFAYMYPYVGAEGRTRFEAAEGLSIIEVKSDGEMDTKVDEFIRYYPVLGQNNKVLTRVEYWTRDMTWYYIYGNGQSMELDPNVPLNPRPHIVYQIKGKMYWEERTHCPLLRLDNNKKQRSGLAPIKGLIDDYDIMNCSLSNNLQDVQEGIYVVRGYRGTNLDELTYNLRAKKVVGVGEHGGVDVQTVNIPYEARKVKLEIDERNIYKFGMGFDSAQVGDGNITNIVIKARYTLLDLKCNKLETRLRRLLRECVRIVVDEINRALGTAYLPEDVAIDISRDLPTNEVDNASIRKTNAETEQIRINTILYAAAKLDNETVVILLCEALDLDADEILSRLPAAPDDLDEVSEALLTDETV